ncbi:MAG: hypothetical protein KDK39_19875 [Leptospiraceae bacterium]|nr:hypothetical protein [Leptospiraceae bacterium]
MVEAYQALKHSYRNYDTKVALRRMQALRRSVQELNRRGYAIALELLGSLNFGLVESSSDVDCILLHYCHEHLHEGECGLGCPNMIFKRDQLLSILKEKTRGETFHIEFLDVLNLKYIEHWLEADSKPEHEPIMRFLFYRFLGRPVNRPLVIHYYEQLEANPELMREFHEYGSQALSAYIQTSGHRHSFTKYNERIQSHQIRLPRDLIEELRNYLDLEQQ